jgi:hypothetical protein
MAKVLKSAASIRTVLTADGFDSGNIFLSNIPLGRFVTHGDIKHKTVYASRIYCSGLKVEVKASKRTSMLEKVAKAIAESVKSGTFNIDSFIAAGNVEKSA